MCCVYLYVFLCMCSLTMSVYAVECGGKARLAELVCWMYWYMTGVRV